MENGLLYLLVVAAIGCGWWLGRRERKDSRPTSGPQYYAGLNYLLSEEPDRAVTRFIEDLGVNQDTIETHLALGSLLRRRGEVEKAVIVHQNILAHGTLEDAVIGNVQLELARDYLLAGLLDRAEELLLILAPRQDKIARQSLVLLVELYEREKEWYKAIAVSEKLVGGDDGASYDRAISHYYCELAQASLAARQIEPAREALRDAIGHDAKNARTSLLLGKLELQQGRFAEAVKALQRIKDQNPVYVPESLPDLIKASEQGGAAAEQVQQYLRACLAQTPSISIVLTLASSIRQASGDEAMAKFIANHLKRNPTIRGLTQLIDLHIDNTSGVAKQNLAILRSFAEALVADKPAYRCHECGFDGKKLHWHCPVCKSWGTIHAIFGLEGE